MFEICMKTKNARQAYFYARAAAPQGAVQKHIFLPNISIRRRYNTL